VFTARYGLIPYIKQITFRLLKVKCVLYIITCIYIYCYVSTSLQKNSRVFNSQTVLHIAINLFVNFCNLLVFYLWLMATSIAQDTT